MRILGVDPGSLKTGVGIIDIHGNRLTHVHHTVIRCGSGEFSQRLNTLFAGLTDIIEEFRPQQAAMEDVFISNNASSALKLGQARGALIAACGNQGLLVTTYSATKVKQSTVGFGRADKAQIKHMIKLLLKPPMPLAEDAADALAVCICHAHHGGMNQLMASGGRRP